MPKSAALIFFFVGAVSAQGPVIIQRGALNAVTLEPAPSRVAQGDLLVLQGLNFGPAEGAVASGTPLPTSLGGVQVMIGTRLAPIFSVNPGEIRVQVPFETNAGLVNVVVQRGDLKSPPAVVRVVATAIAARTKNGLGFGEAGTVEGKQLKLSMTGLGITAPRVATGDIGPADGSAVPRQAVRAYVGGLPANVKASLSPDRVGEFDVAIDLPDAAQPGDIVTVSNGAAPVLRSVLGSTADAVVQYVKLPAGLKDIRALRQSDLRGSYVLANGARGTDGCFPTWIFELDKGIAKPVEPCLLAQANAQTPVNPATENSILASFAGPASDQQNMVSAKVALFNPAQAGVKTVDLPGPAALLGALADGSLVALGGSTPYSINPDSGEVRELTAGAGGIGGGGVIGGAIPGGGAGGGGAAGGIFAGALQIDLGDGLTVLLSAPVAMGQGQTVVIVGDDANKPTRAKLAVLATGGTVSGTRDFPASWLPLVPPAQQVPIGGGPGGGGVGIAFTFGRLPTFFDAASRSLYVLAKKADGSAQGFAAFSGADLTPAVIPFPDGWFAATCAPTLQLSNLQLSGRLALFASKKPQDAVLANCPAQGYLALDLATKATSAVALPGVGEVNTRAAGGDMNDYLYASNTDPQNAALSDTLYIYDSVSGSPFRLDLPPGIVGYQQVTPIPALNGLVATAIATRVAGDGGLVYFDLDNEITTVLPVPDGFTTVSYVGVFTNTRKIVARGIKANGTQYLIYDLVAGNLIMPANPDGVVFAGPLPAAVVTPGGGGGGPGGGGGGPGGGGAGGGGTGQGTIQPQVQAQLVNAKSNTIVALGYDAIRNPVGIIVIKVP